MVKGEREAADGPPQRHKETGQEAVEAQRRVRVEEERRDGGLDGNVWG